MIDLEGILTHQSGLKVPKQESISKTEKKKKKKQKN